MLATSRCTFEIRFNILENGVRAHIRREKSVPSDLPVTGTRGTVSFIFPDAILPSVFYKLSFAGIFVLEAAEEAHSTRYSEISGLLQVVPFHRIFAAKTGRNWI